MHACAALLCPPNVYILVPGEIRSNRVYNDLMCRFTSVTLSWRIENNGCVHPNANKPIFYCPRPCCLFKDEKKNWYENNDEVYTENKTAFLNCRRARPPQGTCDNRPYRFLHRSHNGDIQNVFQTFKKLRESRAKNVSISTRAPIVRNERVKPAATQSKR